ncbi:MAG: hypothetical protein U0441_36675 [Polyangiaceae bacterium]
MKLSCFGFGLGFSAIFLAACGGNVVLDGNTAAGGAGGDSSSSSSSSSSTVTDWCAKLSDDLVAMYESCGITVSTTGTTTECTPAQSAQYQCVDVTCIPLADCPCLKDPTGAGCVDKNQVFSDCISKCIN